MRIRVPPGVLERDVATVEQEVDDRRLMAFAAGVRDTSAALFDVDRPGGIVAHPVFAAALEWPLVRDGAPGLEFCDGGAEQGLHVGHEITVHRPIRGGDVLRTTSRLLAVGARSVGAYALCEFSTATLDGEPVLDTRQGILYLGATLQGLDGAGAPRAPAPPETALRDADEVRIELADAVRYGECSGIINPVHTDARLAREGGLDSPIYQGSAMLAHCVSAAVRSGLRGDPSRVRRIACRFTGAVPMPCTVTVGLGAVGGTLRFGARTGEGAPVLADGVLEVSGPIG
ncbi:hypothetical protein FSW04_19180 [Baekduia soli]|uniref:MaoC-like domain-containing protein n=1 Tax=Baekduia soli TaxID=496014 RepID=A0A5B8U8M4_9ACTN|nr:MaoC/PaaZ C-terminal domain-containing protein [Baekduia soli]QEC49479.1 hypothetical protein FSW04_19180 [Baekduia soli]